jgi:hypothetical protein
MIDVRAHAGLSPPGVRLIIDNVDSDRFAQDSPLGVDVTDSEFYGLALGLSGRRHGARQSQTGADAYGPGVMFTESARRIAPLSQSAVLVAAAILERIKHVTTAKR